MNVNELTVGDVFRVTGHPNPDRRQILWRLEMPGRARALNSKRYEPPLWLTEVRDHEVEVVEHASTAPIRRVGSTLVLKGGDVILTCWGPGRWRSGGPIMGPVLGTEAPRPRRGRRAVVTGMGTSPMLPPGRPLGTANHGQPGERPRLANG